MRGRCAVLLIFGDLVCASLWGQQPATPNVQVDWKHVTATSRSVPTLQVVVNPRIAHGGDLNVPSFAALKELGVDYVRYVPWLPYPRQAVAELEPPKDGKTSWEFRYIDPTLDDFMKATAGHPVILNFSTIPAWMWKTTEPVKYPEDPNQVFWTYTQGTEMRDPSFHEAAGYFARLLSWYTKGGLTDEFGKWHESGHHYKIAYWEVLNEIEGEHNWTPENYTRFYDVVTAAMRKVDPDIKFVALALAGPGVQPKIFEYFLNPANHSGGAPVDFISYHFYAAPADEETMNEWQYTFFDQEDGFLDTVRYIEEIRKRLSPDTKTDLDELGVILPEDDKQRDPSHVVKPEPAGYWNLAAAMYADLYCQLARMGIEVVGESQLVGYPSQYPSVSMMDYVKLKPNARFWVLKLLKDNFAPGDRLVQTWVDNSAVSAQAFVTGERKRLLLINKRLRTAQVVLPAGMEFNRITYVAPSTGDDPPVQRKMSGTTVELEPNEVAVLSQ